MKTLFLASLIFVCSVCGSNAADIDRYDVYQNNQMIASNVSNFEQYDNVIICDHNNECIEHHQTLEYLYEPTGGLLKEETLVEEMSK